MQVFLLLLSSLICSSLAALPTLDWEALFDSLTIYDDNVFAGEFDCTANRSGLMSFLVFDLKLGNTLDSDIVLLELPQFNVTLYNGSGAVANSSFQLAYLRDEFSPSHQPGYEHISYQGLSAGCNVTLPRGIPCQWLEITELVNSTDELELSVVYNSEERNFTLSLAEVKHRFKDSEFNWVGFSIVLAASLAVVFTP
jgi:hypothetical protein